MIAATQDVPAVFQISGYKMTAPVMDRYCVEYPSRRVPVSDDGIMRFIEEKTIRETTMVREKNF